MRRPKKGMVGPKGTAGKPAAKPKKSVRLSVDKIRRAREVLGTATDTGTIEAALDTVIFRQALLDGLKTMAGVDLTTPESMDAPHR